jgi:hypothetical protein
MDLGGKIKQMRNQLGLTQEELADRCELTKGYISQLNCSLSSAVISSSEFIPAGFIQKTKFSSSYKILIITFLR